MKELNKKEMLKVNAGATSGAWLSALWRGVNVFTDIGRYLGSSIRRMVDKNLCRY